MVLHIMHFSVFRYLQDGPAYNPSGYTEDRPAYNISQKIMKHPSLTLTLNPNCSPTKQTLHGLT